MTKEELITFIHWQLFQQQFSWEEKQAHHYGRVELAQLVDRMFPESAPTRPRDFCVNREEA